MTPLVLGLGVPELLIILAVVLLLFGGTRLAGIGKSSGRAIREFKEETKGLDAANKGGATAAGTPGPQDPAHNTATGPQDPAHNTATGPQDPRVTETDRRADGTH